ncbi:hypothetical protein [Rhizobium laguerreae]|uniref:hypothetical protein n=1 Tax=Rhizobium laguerreae TaxID=1076926 RepID=UPI0030088ED8
MSREDGKAGWDRVASAINRAGRKPDASNASAAWKRVAAGIDAETDRSRLHGISVAEQQSQAAASNVIRVQKASADPDNPSGAGGGWAEQLMKKLR